MKERLTILVGDCRDTLKTLPDESVNCVVTSPPYWGLRDYGTATWQGGDAKCDHKKMRSTQRSGLRNDGRKNVGTQPGEKTAALFVPYKSVCAKCGAERIDRQIGLEKSLDEFVRTMVEVFREVRRVLRNDGTCWVNLGDVYNGAGLSGGKGVSEERGQLSHRGAIGAGRVDAGLKHKDMCGIPWRVAFALQADGWYLRQDIIWHKPNPMPESCNDRCTKAHEYIFLLAKSGSPIFWTHRDGRRMDEKPAPEYRYVLRETGKEYKRAPKGWKDLVGEDENRLWRRINLWSGHDYYYDQDAVLEECSPNTHARISQDLEKQIGSERAHGGSKPNGTMKAVTRKAASAAGLLGVKNNPSFSAAVCLRLPKRNKRSVWTVNTFSYAEAHFATYPPDLIRPCILAGCPKDGVVMDLFGGSGTTGAVALEEGRRAILCELNPQYAALARRRCEPSELERARLKALEKPEEILPLFAGIVEEAA
jgi:site-specific DNA-methyltransferase (adenine-specific)